MQENSNSTFVAIVRYIYQNRGRLERFQIDKQLLGFNYEPGEIDRAWKAVVEGQGRAILLASERVPKKRNLTPLELFISTAIGAVLSICLGGFLMIGTLIGWGCIGIWLDTWVKLPSILSFSVFAAGACLTYRSLFLTARSLVQRKLNSGWGVLFIVFQFVIFFLALVQVAGPPPTLPPFDHYPNSTALALPVMASQMEVSQISLQCMVDSFYLTPNEAFYTDDSAEQILDFYKQQADSIDDGLTISSGRDVMVAREPILARGRASNSAQAVCYSGKSFRYYTPVNAVIILRVAEQQDALKAVFPTLSANAQNVVIVFNTVTSRSFI